MPKTGIIQLLEEIDAVNALGKILRIKITGVGSTARCEMAICGCIVPDEKKEKHAKVISPMSEFMSSRIFSAKGFLTKIVSRHILTREDGWINVPKGWNSEQVIALLKSLGITDTDLCSDQSGDVKIKKGGRFCLYRNCPECKDKGWLRPTDVLYNYPKDKIHFSCNCCQVVRTFHNGHLIVAVLST